ncbi:uncharacterized protein BDV17DRAFT_279788 [Aspergillus undulatus]|uniref:uncharacterized protein n=1 Tax=Aspergillus undulatus TaxID=1810928 RepID=UPI003CCD0908
MGKLTYSARKISGVKAGQVVSKDLKKRIPPSTGAKAAARDPTLEIDLTGKNLTDEGFAQFIDDLIQCTLYRSTDHPLGLAKVTEFHLSGNNLTVNSLAKLGAVIAANPGDLRELDLSSNDIKVASDDEKKIWKEFLDSFRNCYVLQKLDLSKNPMGVKGLEILARVYVKSDLDYLEADADAIVRENHGLANGEEAALAEEVEELKVGEKNKENEPRAGRAKKSPAKGGKAAKQNGASPISTPSKAPGLADLRRYACTRGLRSIPYFILSEMGLNNSSAVNLSHMLTIQRASAQLLTFLPPSKASAVPESAQENRSLIWQPNEAFTGFAKRLLDVTEKTIDFKAKIQTSENCDMDDHAESAQQKMQNKLALEFTRLTKRVRIECLKQEGVRVSDIAFTALKMVILSRALLLDDKDRTVEVEVEAEAEEPVEDEEGVTFEHLETVPEDLEQEQAIEQQQFMEEQAIEYSPFSEQVESYCDPGRPSGSAFDYASGPFHPAAHLFDEEFPALQPATRQVHFQVPVMAATSLPEPNDQPIDFSPNSNSSPGKDKDNNADSTMSINTGNAANSSPAQPTRSGGKGTFRGSFAQKVRKRTWRFGLPFELWRRIIVDAVDADGILDHEQQSRVMHYASDWDSVANELTVKGAEEHQQIYKIVDSVGGFIYSPLS